MDYTKQPLAFKLRKPCGFLESKSTVLHGLAIPTGR